MTFDGAPTGQERNLLKASWDAKGEKIAAGSGDQSVAIWESRTGKLLNKLPGHRGAVNDVRFHPLGEPLCKSRTFSLPRTSSLLEFTICRVLRQGWRKLDILSLGLPPNQRQSPSFLNTVQGLRTQRAYSVETPLGKKIFYVLQVSMLLTATIRYMRLTWQIQWSPHRQIAPLWLVSLEDENVEFEALGCQVWSQKHRLTRGKRTEVVKRRSAAPYARHGVVVYVGVDIGHASATLGGRGWSRFRSYRGCKDSESSADAPWARRITTAVQRQQCSRQITTTKTTKTKVVYVCCSMVPVAQLRWRLLVRSSSGATK